MIGPTLFAALVWGSVGLVFAVLWYVVWAMAADRA